MKKRITHKAMLATGNTIHALGKDAYDRAINRNQDGVYFTYWASYNNVLLTIYGQFEWAEVGYEKAKAKVPGYGGRSRHSLDEIAGIYKNYADYVTHPFRFNKYLAEWHGEKARHAMQLATYLGRKRALCEAGPLLLELGVIEEVLV